MTGAEVAQLIQQLGAFDGFPDQLDEECTKVRAALFAVYTQLKQAGALPNREYSEYGRLVSSFSPCLGWRSSSRQLSWTRERG